MPGKSPDPSEFTIGDDESTIGTPVPEQEGANGAQEKPQLNEQDDQGAPSKTTSDDTHAADGTEEAPRVLQDLPPEVKSKLRRLDKLESKYAELLKAYRTAHARVQSIEPFEATLRESTPLTSITDPTALSEYLTQINTKSGMVLEELKRVSGERDGYKQRTDMSETKVKELEDTVVDLKKQLTDRPHADSAESPKPLPTDAVRSTDGTLASADPTPSVTSPKSASSRIPSLSIFSPKSRPKLDEHKDQDVSEDLFSFDSEVPRLEAQLGEKQEEVDSLTTRVSNLQKDLKVARESTEGMVHTLETTSEELNALRDAKEKWDTTEKELRTRIQELEKEAEHPVESKDHEEKLASLRHDLEDTQSQLTEAKRRTVQLETQETEVKSSMHQAMNEVDNLNKQLDEEKKTADALNRIVQQKDHINKDLEDSLAFAKKAEREHESAAKELQASERRVQTMQGIMDSLRSQLDKAGTTASELREQVSKTEQESKVPKEEPAQISTVAPAAQEDAAPSGKKKNKKKKKGKGPSAAGTEPEPQEAVEPVAAVNEATARNSRALSWR